MLNYDEVMKKIGSNLKKERVFKNYTQEQLADLAHVHRNYISLIERGQQNLTMKKIIDLANILETPLEKIIL